MVGARNKQEQRNIEAFLRRYQIIEVSESIGQHAYQLIKQYAKSHGLAMGDALIAATTILSDLTLVSRNEKHFRPIQGLKFVRAGY